jgi:phosphatidylethanolamine/phosphatidyl-N-methylethanolamine N-methyltransferase
MAEQEHLEGQKRAYARWAAIYDTVYHRLLADAHRRTAAVAAQAGPDILEIGVGTGLVLRYYPPHARVVGVDLSVDMLRKAREKASALPQVTGVAAMDAGRLGLPAERFDAVAVPFVITLVPDPERALAECARVLRPGGSLVIASKLSGDEGLLARIETAVAPLARKVGWSADFRLSRIRAWAGRNGFEVRQVAPLFPLGFFKLMHLVKPVGSGLS